MKRYAPFVLLLLLAGCQKSIHPGAIDEFDSKTYDTLLVAQSVLDGAKIAYKEGKLPADSKAVINGFGQTYDLLRDLWLEYRVSPNQATADKIIAMTQKVNQFILDLRGMGVKQ